MVLDLALVCTFKIEGKYKSCGFPLPLTQREFQQLFHHLVNFWGWLFYKLVAFLNDFFSVPRDR